MAVEDGGQRASASRASVDLDPRARDAGRAPAASDTTADGAAGDGLARERRAVGAAPRGRRRPTPGAARRESYATPGRLGAPPACRRRAARRRAPESAELGERGPASVMRHRLRPAGRGGVPARGVRMHASRRIERRPGGGLLVDDEPVAVDAAPHAEPGRASRSASRALSPRRSGIRPSGERLRHPLRAIGALTGCGARPRLVVARHEHGRRRD